MNLSNYIKQRRIDKGLTQAEVAKVLGYKNAQFVSNIERGVAGPPPKHIRKLIKLLDLDKNMVMGILMKAQESFIKSYL